MNKLVISLLFLVTILSCDKELGDLKFSETIPGGCALDKGLNVKNNYTSDVDKVTYSIVNGNLEILVGFNATCCGEPLTTSQIVGDTIVIEISTPNLTLCNCICYYTYNFKFIGSGQHYNYKVTVDTSLKFTGEINL